MRFTIERTGPDVDALIDRTVREMSRTSRTVGNAIKKAGVAAVRKAVPYKSFAGYPLKVKGKVRAAASGVEVDIYGTPVGFWSMLESGAKPHPIRPRKGKALRLGSDTFYAHVDHPGMAGRSVWSNARPALVAAVDKVVEDTYSKVLIS